MKKMRSACAKCLMIKASLWLCVPLNHWKVAANGNLKSESDRILEKSTEYAYDVGNRMVQAVRKEKGDAVLTQTNRYNGSGQRIQKTEDGKTTNYYYQGTAVRATTDAEGNKSSFNLYGLEGNVIASGRYTGSCAGEYLTSGKDLKGSITSLIKPDGSCAAVYRYTDFGETVMYAAEDVENEICYTGGIYDESTGLYYLNARYYDPQDGRFTSQDTYRGKDEEYKTWNLYTYCANNPVGYIDPSGHFALAAGGLAALAELLSNAAVSLGVTALIYKGIESVVAPERSVFKPRIPAVPKTPSVANPRTRPATKAPTVSRPRVLPTSKAPAVPRPKVTTRTGTKGRTVTQAKSKKSDEDGYQPNARQREQTGRTQHGKTPRNNQKQNKQARDAKRGKVSKKDRAQFHDEVTGMGYGFKEMVKIAEEYARRRKKYK